MSENAAFVGLDVETTGLNPRKDWLLEVGVVLFDDSLWPLSSRTWLIQPTAWKGFTKSFPETWFREVMKIFTETWSPEVREMHTANGLINEIITDPGALHSIHEAEQEIIEFLEEHNATGLPMLGSSVSFDRSFLAVKMPDLLAAFSHRSVDATSVKLAVVAGEAPEHRETTKADIELFRGQVSEKFLMELGRQGEPRHRPIRDLCDSAALVCASINKVYSVGFNDGKTGQ